MEYITPVAGLRWRLVMTLPRGESRVETFFKGAGIPCYLPRLRRSYANRFPGRGGKRYDYRRKAVAIPMFPGYIFAALNVETLSSTRSQRMVARVFTGETYIEDELISELNAVREFELLAADHEIELKPELTPGTPVEIFSGPFAGWNGVVDHREANNYIFINLSCIAYSIGISCAAADCEAR